MPPEPVFDENLGETKTTMNKRMIEARGYEPIHTEVPPSFKQKQNF